MDRRRSRGLHLLEGILFAVGEKAAGSVNCSVSGSGVNFASGNGLSAR
jgi:hypothetical protein